MSFATPYPGVYLREISSGVRTITGVATSITAFIGRAARGPVNEAVTINNFGDFERIFGGLDVNCLMSYAVRDFYLNGGSQAIIVRLYKPGEATKLEGDQLELVKGEVTKLFDFAKNIAQPQGATKEQVQLAVINKAKELVDGNNGVGTIYKDKHLALHNADCALKTAQLQGGELGNLQNSFDSAKTNFEAAKSNFDNVSYFFEQTKKKLAAMPLDKIKEADSANLAVGILAKAETKAKLKQGNDFTLIAANEGAWGNHLVMSIDHRVSQDVAEYLGVSESDLFNLTITDTKTNVTESYLNLTVVESSRKVDRILESESSLVRYFGDDLPANIPNATNDPENPIRVEDHNKAVDSQSLGVDEYKGSQLKKTGIYALENVDLFNLLCIPPDSRDGDGDVDTGVWGNAMSYCEKRRAILIVDAPKEWKDANDIISNQKLTGLGLSGEMARNAAIYFPRVLQADEKRNGQVSDFAPCGIVAGLISKNDAQRGVWTSPAGIDVALNGIRGLKVNLTDAENGMLNPLGINCLRSFPVTGRVIWGARTLRGADRIADEYKYLAVRRTALFIQESLYRGLNWVVFKPNDEPLWAQIRLNVGAFMHNLFRQGAFQGMSPRDAYFVKCDRETTTQNDINSGVVNIVVGFAPLKPAEFVVVKLQQIAGSIQT